MTFQTYHIVYRDTSETYMASGRNVEASDEIIALQKWRVHYPNAIFISIKLL